MVALTHMKSLFAICITATFVPQVIALKNQKNEQSILNSAKAQLDDTIPNGGYSESCISCSMVSGTNIQPTSTLTCQCYDSVGTLSPASFLQNAWACDGCIINRNGELACFMPISSSDNGYQALCSGCGIYSGSLFCKSCNGITPTNPFSLPNACSCTSVSFDFGFLVCNVETPTPTSFPTPEPTAQPTTMPTSSPVPPPTFSPTTISPSTKSPTPNAAPLTCESYWLDVSAKGEKAPYKPCENGAFTTANGCQYQNYCCWYPESATNPQTVGTCKVPNGVPVDCPQLEQQQCEENATFCFWNADYGSSGLCQRRCPGNPQTLCSLT